MPSLAELATERREKLKKFNYDLYDQAAQFDVTQLNDWIEKTPVISDEDAFAALDIILEHIESGQHLAVAMVIAVRKYLERGEQP